MRTFLKVLGILTLIPLCILFVCLAQSLILLDAVHAAVGDADSFQEDFDRSFPTSRLERLASGLIDWIESETSPGEATPAPEAEGDHPLFFDIDPLWFSETLRTVTLGTHAYFTGASDEMPSIEVGSLLDSLENGIIDKIVENAGPYAEARLQTAAAELRMLTGGGLKDGEPTSAALVLARTYRDLQDLDLSDEELAQVVKALLTPAEPGSAESLTERMARAFIASRLRLSSAARTISIGDFVTNLFETEDHILRVGRDRSLDIARTSTAMLVWLLALVAALILLLSFSPRTSPLWIGIPLVVTCVGTLLTALSNAALQPLIARGLNDALNLGKADPGASSIELDGVKDLALMLFDRFMNRLLVDGLVLLLVGILLIVLSIVFFMRRRRKTAKESVTAEKPLAWIWYLGRAVLIAVTLFLMVVTVSVHVNRIAADVRAIQNAATAPKTDKLFEVIDETLGTNFSAFVEDQGPSDDWQP